MDIQEIRKLNLNLLSKQHGRATTAEMLGYQDTNYLNLLCSGHSNIGNKTARKIEAAFNLGHGGLDQLIEAPEQDLVKERTASYSVEALINQLKHTHPEALELLKHNPGKISTTVKVPLYEWEDLGKVLEGKTKTPKRWVYTDTEGAQDDTLATTMRGISMASNTVPSIPAGATLIINPCNTIPDALPCIVIASIKGDITCRRLTKEAGQHQLEALNEDYKPTPLDHENDQILGCVMHTSTL